MRAYQIEQTALDDADLTDEFRATNSATYCPEDDKIRLYLSRRVSRDSFLYLKKCGYVATPKQDCSFAAVWSIDAEDVALQLIADDDDIGDEDYSPAERAADRAERFAGYRENRRRDAGALADRYDAGSSAIGYQNAGRAERAAARRDRVRDRSLCQWDKAEYWQQRTAGVISHALHKSSAHVRRGRVLTIESEIRIIESRYTPREPRQTYDDSERGTLVWCGKGRGGYWQPLAQLDQIKAGYARHLEHLRMRLIYENAMLANEGGQASECEMEPGGWLGGMQIHKINRSPATKRIVSIGIWGPHPWRKDADGNPVMGVQSINIERMGTRAYRAPTEEERAAFADKKSKAPKAPPLVNPTIEDAQRLQAVWNRLPKNSSGKPQEILILTQADYTRKSAYDLYGIRTFQGVRVRRYDNYCNPNPPRVIVISDKPQKALPIDWAKLEPSPAPAPVVENPALAPIDRQAVPAGQLF